MGERETVEEQGPTKEQEEAVYTTHAVRLLAHKLKVDITKVQGTGKRGRVTKEDILNFVETGGKRVEVQAPGAPKLQAPVVLKADKVVKLTGFRRAMAKSMTDSLTIPHHNIQDEFSIESMKKVRNAYLKANAGKKITFTPFFMKAFSSALTAYPVFNAISNPAKDDEGSIFEYVEKAEHNISVAVDTPVGLLVPNLKSVQRKSILQVNDELRELIERARKVTLTQDDLTNGTFTLSNIGNIGCITGSPVIFRPQVSIVALGQTRMVPRFYVEKGVSKMRPEEAITMSVSFDHRVIDGATGANFVRTVKQYLENMDILLLTLK
jgi:2-oxoisovalerate dehydrogenase E2 component (dihydrolipoyl transacylase)